MVRLEVVENEIIDVAEASSGSRKLAGELSRGANPVAHEVDERDFFAFHKIRIERYSIWYGPDAFEKIIASDIRMDCIDARRYGMYFHGISSLLCQPRLQGKVQQRPCRHRI
jgi:hypothetical protein